jgi:hypothetical protein
MSIDLSIEIWLTSSALIVILCHWMMFDVVADYGAASALVHYRVPGFGEQHVVAARMNIIREAFRIFVGLTFLVAGYIAWVQPYWAYPELVVHLLVAGNVGLLLKTIIDRHARVVVRRMIQPKRREEMVDGELQS